MKKFLLLISLLLFACSTPGDLKKLSEDYPTVWGRLAAPPTVESHRLFLYIKVAPKEGQGEGTILVCIAENKEREEILQRLSERAVESGEANKPLALIGKPVQGPWQEYAEGIDFEIFAVGYYNPKAQKYQTVITTYGDSLRDLINSMSWSHFIQSLGKKAIDAAL